MRTFLAFLRLWVEHLFWAESFAGKVAKIVGTLVWLSAVATPHLAARLSSWQVWPLGWTILAPVGLIYVAWSGGAAWVRSRGPRLWVAKELLSDLDHEMFRLLVANRGEGVLMPQAAMRWVKVNGEPRFAGVGPFPLEWLHLDRDERPRLAHGDEITLALAYASGRNVAFAGSFRYRPTIDDTEVRSAIECCVRVSVPETRQFEERIIRLSPAPGLPLRYQGIVEVPARGWRMERRSHR